MYDKSDRILLCGGQVLTMDGVNTTQEAIVLEGKRILALGSKDDMKALAGKHADIIDVKGATVMPGLVDGHPHLLHFGALECSLVNILDATSHDDIVSRIKERAAQTPPGEWIITTPVGEPHYFLRRNFRDLLEGRLPNRRILDHAAPAHPVFIQAWAPVTPNTCAFNSLGLERMGISHATPDKVCSVSIEKDDAGRPTGILRGNVNNYYTNDPFWLQIWSKFPSPPEELWELGVYYAQADFAKMGVTSLYEAHCMEAEHIRAYQSVADKGDLSVRVVAGLELFNSPFNPHIETTPERLRERLALGLALQDLDNEQVRVNGVTLSRGGPCWPGFLRQHEPYRGPEGEITRGHTFVPHWTEAESVRFCLENDLRFNMVMGGLRDHDDFLDTLTEIAMDGDIATRQWVIQHSILIARHHVKRYADLQFDMTTSAGFSWGKGVMYGERMGKEVWPHLIPLKRIIDAGLNLSCGRDWGPNSRFEHMALSQSFEFCGSEYCNDDAEHAISREQALACWTRNGAELMQWEDIGCLAAGNYADLIVVDRNPLTCTIEDLKKTSVLRTLFNGQTVWNDGSL